LHNENYAYKTECIEREETICIFTLSGQGFYEVSVRNESRHIEQPSQLPHNFETTTTNLKSFRILFLQVIFKDLPMTLYKDEMEYGQKRNYDMQ
jgi:hypothetical protein